MITYIYICGAVSVAFLLFIIVLLCLIDGPKSWKEHHEKR